MKMKNNEAPTMYNPWRDHRPVIKKAILYFVSGLLLSSCGFLFYNYRAYVDTEYLIPNAKADTLVRIQTGKLIYRLSAREKFYTRFSTPAFDSLYFYGPDYHDFVFKISEEGKGTKILLHYFGYNGNRKKPPHKLFLDAISDSLIALGATKTIIRDITNEKRRDKKKSY
jgi:hypothetical protein